MKALIRNPGETVLESYNIPCIDWNTGAPLTNPGWSGGPYILVNDYVPDTPDEDFVEPAIVTEPIEETATIEEADFIEIDGKRYSKEELRRLIE